MLSNENLVHSIFRNESSTLEINVSHFWVLHWQQWQPPASAPVNFVNLTSLNFEVDRDSSRYFSPTTNFALWCSNFPFPACELPTFDN